MSIPTTHKVLYLLSKFGSYAVQTVDLPYPAADEALVKVESTSLNPADWKIQAWGVIATTFPTVIGFAAGGVVVAVGKDVTRIRVGDRVMAEGQFTDDSNTFQQYIRTPANLLSKIPGTMSFDEASTLPVSAPSAAMPLYNPSSEASSARLTPPWATGGLGKYAGKAAIVLGGSTSVGQAAIQFLRLSGFSPVITTASPHNIDTLKSFGATHVLDRKLADEELLAEVAKLSGGHVDIVYDGISSDVTQNLGFDLVSPAGTLVIVNPEKLTDERKGSGKSVSVVRTAGVTSLPPNREFGPVFAQSLEGLLEDGLIKPNVVEVIPGGLSAIPGALERLKAGEVSGRKLVVHPHELD